MMSPLSFDEFVVPYEGKLVHQLKKYNIPIECHCHGKVRYALGRMIEMGYDATNPVEPPPQGDITFAEAREMVYGKLTIVGNFELVEIEQEQPLHIEKRVHELLSLGYNRLILSDAGGLRQALTEKMVNNYKAWVDTYVKLCC